MKDIVELNIQSVWLKYNENWLQKNVGNPLNEISDSEIIDKAIALGDKEKRVDSKLHSRLYPIATDCFYLSFIAGLVLLAASVVYKG